MLVTVVVAVILTRLHCGDADDLRHLQLMEGEDLVVMCPAQLDQLESYRWVFVRRGSRRPLVITSGRKLMVGEQRLSLQVPENEDGQASLDLTLKDITRRDAGVYMCWRRGLKPHPQISVTVLDAGSQPQPQRVTRLIAPRTVHYSAPASLNCTISPARSAQVTWLRDGRRIPLSDTSYRHSFVQTSPTELTFTLHVVSMRDDAIFACYLPANPESRSDATVRVMADRVELLVSRPPVSEVHYGQTLTLTCTASGTSDRIVWLKDGSTFTPSEGREELPQSHAGDGRYVSSLRIKAFSRADNGHYVCYFRGASKDVLVNIESRMGVLLGLDSSQLILGRPLVLSCRTQYARDDENVEWTVDGSLLPDEKVSQQYTSTNYEPHNVTRHDLVYPQPTAEQEAKYTCTSAYGSSSVHVKRMEPPALLHWQSIVTMESGKRLLVVCDVTGLPQPIISWLRMSEDGQWRAESTSSSLFSKIAELEDSGTFMCVADNDAGHVNATILITVQEPQPHILSMTSSGAVDGEDLEVTCVVENWQGPVDIVSEKHTLRGYDGESRFSMMRRVVTLPSAVDDRLSDNATEEDARINSGTHNYVKRQAEWISENALQHEDENGRKIMILDDELNEAKLLNNIAIPPPVEEWKELRTTEHHDDDVDNSEMTPLEVTKSPIVWAHTLRVTAVSSEDQGVYSCHAGPNGAISYLPIIIGARSPYIVSVSTNQDNVGGLLLVTCTVANWDHMVTFQHNNSQIDVDSKPRYQMGHVLDGILQGVDINYPEAAQQRLNVTDTSSVVKHPRDKLSQFVLTVTDAVCEDSGVYSCQLQDQLMQAALVTVQQKSEEVLSLSGPPVALIGGDLVLSCHVIGWLGDVTFLHNHTTMTEGHVFSQPMNSSTLEQDFGTSTTDEALESGADRGVSMSIHQIVVSNISWSSGGEYACYTSSVVDRKAVFITVRDVAVQFSVIGGSEDLWMDSLLVLRCGVEGPLMEGLQIEFIHDGRVEGSLVDEGQQCGLNSTTETAASLLLIDNTIDTVSVDGSNTTNDSSEDVSVCATDASAILRRSYHLVDPVEASTKGEWSCVARWGQMMWPAQGSEHLTVLEQPRLVSVPGSHILVPPGSPLVLECSAEGHPDPVVKWTTDEGTLMAEGTSQATLVLETLDHDSGFVCSATVRDRTVTARTQVTLHWVTHAGDDTIQSTSSTAEPQKGPYDDSYDDGYDSPGHGDTYNDTSHDYYEQQHFSGIITTTPSEVVTAASPTTADVSSHPTMSAADASFDTATTDFAIVTAANDTFQEYYDANIDENLDTNVDGSFGDYYHDNVSLDNEIDIGSTTMSVTLPDYDINGNFNITHDYNNAIDADFNESEDGDEAIIDMNESVYNATGNVTEHELEVEEWQEIELPCPPYTTLSDITWTRGSEQLSHNVEVLFFGALDLAGVRGLSVTDEGHLFIQPHSELLPETFTCLVFNPDTWEDVPVHTYYINAKAETVPVSPVEDDPPLPPTNEVQVPGLVTLVGNTERATQAAAILLEEKGVSVIMGTTNDCSRYETQLWAGSEEFTFNDCGHTRTMLQYVLHKQPLVVVLEVTAHLEPEYGVERKEGLLLYLYDGDGGSLATVALQQDLLPSLPTETSHAGTDLRFLAALQKTIHCIMSSDCPPTSLMPPMAN